MALTGTPRSRGVYDDKRCFETYMSWGAAATHSKLRAWCKQVGMVGTQTGRASQMGAYWAMWRYALENPEEGYELYREWWYENDPSKRMPTLKGFLVDIQNHAWNNKSVASVSKYEAFCEKYDLPALPQKVKITFEQRFLFSANGEFHEEHKQNQEISGKAGDSLSGLPPDGEVNPVPVQDGGGEN